MSGDLRDEVELDALLEAVAAEVQADGGACAGDEALIARGIDAAIARAAQANRTRALARRRRWARGVLLVAAVLVATSGAFALIDHVRSARRTPEQPRAIEMEPSRAPRPTAAPLEVARPTEASSVEAPGASSTHAPPARSAELTAAELYARANDTRRHGDAAAAARQYGALQRRFRGSPEAALSRVALGRLYLDRLGDPARAIAQFDEYLAGGGELREEALVGRALALQQLGRAAEERDAWQALLAAFPNSLSADRAAARLAELH